MKNKLNRLFSAYPKTSVVIIFIFFITTEALFSFCTRVKCPAFSDENFDAWFPYEEGEQLHFETADNRKNSIAIIEVERSGPGEVAGSWHGPSCEMHTSMRSDTSQDVSFYLHYSKVGKDHKTLSLDLCGTSFVAWDVTEQGLDLYGGENYHATWHSSLSINGKTFTDVQLVEVDTTVNTQARVQDVLRVKKFWLAKQQGLIGFERYPSDGIWVRQ